MRATVGDKVVVHGHHVGENERSAVILGVEGPEGEPPYLVRWDDGHESTFFPGADASVEHYPVPAPGE